MYDQHIRTQLAREQAENLRNYWPSVDSQHRVREALAVGLMRAGKKLEPKSTPRPGLSSRA